MATQQHGTSPSQLIRYLHDCHRADSRELAITNLLGSRVRHRLFMSGREELLDGTLTRLAVSPEWAEPAMASVAVYRRERSLVYASFFLVGHQVELEGRRRQLCAPLVFYPAEISQETVAGEPMTFVSADLSEQRFNVPVLSALIGDVETASHALETLLVELPEAPFGARTAHELAELVDAVMPQVDASALYRYPELVEEGDVRGFVRAAGGAEGQPIRLLPASALALIENPPESRGVLFELSSLAAGETLGAALRSVVRPGGPAGAPPHPQAAAHAPAILSAPQRAASSSAAVNPLTLVVGPPGTGKSFTAAALALDHLYRGETVLFASRGNQALDVIADKLEGMLGESGFIIRGGRKAYLRDMKDQLEQLLLGVLPLEGHDQGDLKPARRRLAGVERKIRWLERRLTALGGAEQRLGELVLGEWPRGRVARVWLPLRRRFLEWRLARARPHWELMAEYQAALELRVSLLSRILKIRMRAHLERALQDHRRDLKRFLQALRARTSSKQERLFGEMDLRVLLKAFPVWLASLSGIHRVLPLEPDLFDLVIVDEATQCDAASCLPVLHRARRVVVAGDSKQLRHISFLSRKRQASIADRYGLTETTRTAFDYRDKGLLDVVEDAVETSRQVVFLDEHYRSQPPIIAFSNREFYRGALKVMTRQPDASLEPCLELRPVGGAKEPGGPNRQEARALVDEVARRVNSEAALDERICHSIGILSPFRDQVELLRALVAESIPLHALERHDVKIGTAYSFQGEERDVMLLSLAVDSDSSAATFRYLNRPDVFNVSVTRARNRQYVFVSISPQEAPRGSLLQRYLQEVASERTPERPARDLPNDAFLEAVGAALREAGCQVWPAFPVAGLTVDLMARRDSRTVGVDLIGHPGRFAEAFPLERYRMLLRAGLTAIPLPYSAWRRDPEGALQAVLAQGLGNPLP